MGLKIQCSAWANVHARRKSKDTVYNRERNLSPVLKISKKALVQARHSEIPDQAQVNTRIYS